MSRGLLFAIAISLFGALNAIAISQLLRIHPRARRITICVVLLANVMWLFLPILNDRTDFSRLVRAIFGPPWFSWLLFLLLYCAMLLVTAMAWLPFRRRATFARFAHTPSLTFLVLTVVAGLGGLWAAVVSLRIEHVPIRIAGLPPNLDGTRLAVMGDLHTGLFTRPSRLRQFFSAAAATKPDAIILAGDLIDDDPAFVPKLLSAASTLPPQLPLLAVLGNHEMYGDPFAVIRKLQRSRIRLLVNEGYSLRGLWIAGVSDYAASSSAREIALRPDIDAALAHRPALAFPIVVAHQPKIFADAQARAIALSICAHTHGGQFGFRPFHWSLAGLFLRYHMGLYREGASQLYVNTGTGFWLVPFRLGMTPEITIIDLSAGDSTGSRRDDPPRSVAFAHRMNRRLPAVPRAR